MERRTIDIDGPVSYLDFGGEGPPMVLVHGLGGSALNWIAVAPRLAEQARVYALDLPGFGHTPLAGRTAEASEARYVLHRFATEVGGAPVILVGNSMGGLITLMEAAEAPERVRGLALVSPAQPPVLTRQSSLAFAAQVSLVSIPVLGEAMLRWQMQADPERYVENFFSMVCRRPERVPEEIRREHVALARARREMDWAPRAFAEATRSLIPLLKAPRYYRMADRVRAPTLLLHGRADRLVAPEASRALAARRPEWRFEELEDVGHVPQMETPDAFVDRLGGWLASEPGLKAA